MLLALPLTARAQDSTAVTVAAAAALQGSGDFAAAAAMLRAILAREPGNGDAARMLAQTLYWMKDFRGASTVYEQAIATHPDDSRLRLDYARMLVETRSDTRAEQILRPLRDNPATASEAATLLGTMQYWSGDLSKAASSFRAALAADAENAEARKNLAGIRSISSPWVALGTHALSDDQPLDRVQGDFEAGWFPDPLLALSVRATPMHFRLGDTASATVAPLEIGLSHSAPAARLRTKLAAGVVYRTESDKSTDWTARGSLELRLPNQVALGVRGARAPYLSTLSSLRTPVMSETGAVYVAVENFKGWLAESAAGVERFPDDNSVTTLYAWVLAPLVRASQVDAKAGYAFASQDSRETRFDFSSAIYDPYYTPDRFVAHSAVASLALRPSPRTTVTVRGSYAFKSREYAPQIGVISLANSFVRRDINPWDAHFSISSALSPAVTLSANLDRMRTPFYTATTAGIRLSWKFLPD